MAAGDFEACLAVGGLVGGGVVGDMPSVVGDGFEEAMRVKEDGDWEEWLMGNFCSWIDGRRGFPSAKYGYTWQLQDEFGCRD